MNTGTDEGGQEGKQGETGRDTPITLTPLAVGGEGGGGGLLLCIASIQPAVRASNETTSKDQGTRPPSCRARLGRASEVCG